MTELKHPTRPDAVPVPSRRPTPWRPWALGWLGVLGLAVVIGGVHRGYEVAVGALWGAGTVGFEFLGGHYLNGDEWQTLVRAYDVTAGHPWPVTVAGVMLAPPAARLWHRRTRRHRPGTARP